MTSAILIDQCLVSCSAIIRDTSYYSRWQQIKRLISDIMKRIRDLGTLIPKWNIIINSLLSGLREPCGRAKGMEDFKGNKALYINIVNVQVNTQKLRQHVQGLTARAERRSGHASPSLT